MSISTLLIPFYLLIAVVTLLAVWWRKRLNYWADRGVVHDKPEIFAGNLGEVGRTLVLRNRLQLFYEKYKNVAPFGGFYLSMRISAVILDLDLIKNILVRDFNSFCDRGNYHNVKDDPLSGNLFNLDGASWRNIRSKLTPTFTGSKMKTLFPIVVEVANVFVKVLQKECEKVQVERSKEKSPVLESIEMKELLGRFATDVAGCCAFGLDCNSLEDPETKFRTMGKKIFAERRHGRLKLTFMLAFPNLARKLGIIGSPPDVVDFFLNVIYDTVAYREKTGFERKDFLHLLLEIRKQKNGFTLNEVAAQAATFFVAGFETSSSTMAFALYELSMNQDIQAKARDEIESVLANFDGQITYEGLLEMDYLRQIVYETLRKYSVATALLRKTVNDYQVPNTKHIIEKGTMIVIPVDAIHRDPEIYPDPERFDPTRFAHEAIAKRHPMTWLPFGEGSRNCIGLRFGKMSVMIALALLLKNFKFSLAPATKVPLEFKLKSFELTSRDGIYLYAEPIARSE